MKLTRSVVGIMASAVLAAGAVAAVQASPAQAHGAMMIPGNRTYLCYLDGLLPQGGIQNTNPACAAAVAQSGPNSLYNWFAQLRSDGAGRMAGFIPDGKLCSADAKVYDFSGFDLARDDWPLTHLTGGANLDFNYSNWAAHPGTFYLYVTKDGFDPTKPLAWSDLESQPFASITNPPQKGSVGSIDGHYYWTAKLPSKTGRHIIYSVWSRSDSTETFYNCSDVVFDGGTGQVTGIRGSSPNPTTTTPTTTTTTTTPTTTTTTTPPPTTTTTTTTTVPTTTTTTPSSTSSPKTTKKKVCKTGKNGKKTCKTITKTIKKTKKNAQVVGAACAATAVTNTWGSGFQSVLTVTNTGTQPLRTWTASADAAGITQVWGDARAAASMAGSRLVVAASAKAGVLAPGESVSAGVVADGAASTGALTCSAG